MLEIISKRRDDQWVSPEEDLYPWPVYVITSQSTEKRERDSYRETDKEFNYGDAVELNEIYCRWNP